MFRLSKFGSNGNGQARPPQPYSRQTLNKHSRLKGATVTQSVCPYCAVGCGTNIYTKDGKVIDIEGNPQSPVSEGCPSYTGVLLSCTSNPLWCKNPWLGPLFAASAISTGAESISLVMDCGDVEPHGQSALKQADTIAHCVELLMMRGFLKYAGEKAQPLRSGRMKKYHHFSTGALIGAEVLKHLPVPRRLNRPARMLSMALGLAGGFALRWGMVFGGHDAAADPHLSRAVSRRPRNKSERTSGPPAKPHERASLHGALP